MANDYLLKTWREIAYNQEQTQEQYNQFWGAYFVQEKEVYKDILGHPDVVVKGTVEELAKKYNMEVLTMVGFLDGINESLKAVSYTHLPKGKREKPSLRELEQQIRRDIEDGIDLSLIHI